MRILPAVALLATAFATPLVLAQAKQPEVAGAVATAPGKGMAVRYATAQATVQSTDPKTRSVTLKMPKGDLKTVIAGDEVRNFDQIKAGDVVTVEYAEALTLELKKGGKALVARTEQSGMDRSKPGDKPGGVAAREVKVVADVMHVDEKAKMVQVKGPSGNVIDLNIRDPEQLKLIKKGDQIEATYTEAVAVSLKPMTKAAAPAPAPKKK